MSLSKRHQRRKKSTINVEAFMVKYGLQIAGIMLIVGGLIYLLASNVKMFRVSDLLNTFASHTDQGSYIVQSATSNLRGYFALLMYLPGILLVGLPVLLKSRICRWRNFLSAAGILLLVVCEIRIMMGVRSHEIVLGYFVIWISLIIVQLGVTAASLAGRNSFALNGSIVLFFISVFLVRLIYGVIVPNLIYLFVFQLVVCLFCFRFQWRSSFALLMALSVFYISYYFIKLVLVAEFAADEASVYMIPSLLAWFLLAVVGFGVLPPVVDHQKIIAITWAWFPFVSFFVVLSFCLGFYFKAGVNYLYLASYSLAVLFLTGIAFFLHKKACLRNSDTFYLLLCLFSAFLLPQFLAADFFLFLSVSLSIALLVSVMFTDLKISFRLSLGLYLLTLGLYLFKWIFGIIPGLINQRASGQVYDQGFISGGLLLLALAYFFFTLFPRLLEDYSFSHTQAKKYKALVRVCFYSILYLSVYLLFDYLLVRLVTDYRANFIEWGFYTYAFLFFVLWSQPPRHRNSQKYLFFLSVALIILYLVFVQPETIYFRTLYLAGTAPALFPFLLHYACLAMLLIYIIMVHNKVQKVIVKSRLFSGIRILTAITFLCFILLSEYDHLVLLTLSRFSGQPSYEMLQYNKFIPYSVILMLVAIALLVWSVIHYTRLLRRISMLMIFAVLLKVLFIDITMLSAGKGILLLITLGIMLLLFSIFFARKQSRVAENREINSENSTSEISSGK